MRAKEVSDTAGEEHVDAVVHSFTRFPKVIVTSSVSTARSFQGNPPRLFGYFGLPGRIRLRDGSISPAAITAASGGGLGAGGFYVRRAEVQAQRRRRTG